MRKPCLPPGLQSAKLIACLATVIYCTAASGIAQISQVNNSTMVPTPGIGHNYIGALSEVVDPANGDVSVRIKTPVPPGRKLTLPFSFAYDSSSVHFATGFATTA